MQSKRAKVLSLISFVLFFALTVRVLYLSSANCSAIRETVKNQQLKKTEVKKLRGTIADKSGIPFTDQALGEMSITSDGSFKTKTDDALYTFSVNRRSSEHAAHVIGYTAADSTGLSGIEEKFNSLLKDKGEISLSYMANAKGEPLDTFFVIKNPTHDKSEVRLTLSYHIQKIAEEVMDKYIQKGAAVIIDTQTFDILAMVSRPDFDGENIAKYQTSTEGELLNRAVMGYNAGSVFKIITAAAALEKSPLYTERFFNCLGRFDLDENTVFHCHKADGHGMVSFSDAFAASCNCAFYILGLEVGGADIIKTAQDFGMGSSLLGGYSFENGGNLPNNICYTAGDNLNLSIGQGEILITPLQCAVMAATVANGGVRKNVNLVSQIINADGEVKDAKTAGEIQVIKAETASILKAMMRQCATTGTAKAAGLSLAMISGKTGSAETGWIENGEALVHGWFCGFFPYDSPRYAMALLSEGGKSGAESCVLPFVEIAEKINEIYPFK